MDISCCRVCGISGLQNFFDSDIKKGRSKPACKKCSAKETTARFRRVKALAIQEKGGKCVICGYDKCQAALEFHHLDPSKKDPNWKSMRTKNPVKIIEELEKCILLCSNCHSEAHYKGG